MNDKLLEMFFQPQRWEAVIAKGIGKDIRPDQLYQLTKVETRLALYRSIKEGRYEVSPPHIQKIPKNELDPVTHLMKYREVCINEPIDRIVLSICNDLLFETCHDMVHPACKSYQKGIGCGKVVQEVSRSVVEQARCVSANYHGRSPKVGWKADFTKYFDKVPVEYIDKAFDDAEQRVGHSALIDVLRKYYHSDLVFDENGALQSQYRSLKQGCAVAAWLADVVMYPLDARLSALDVTYYRYSDDTYCTGHEWKRAMDEMVRILKRMRMQLNPKKVEYLQADKWFKFLGYSIKGSMISISEGRLHTFVSEVRQRTVADRSVSFRTAVNRINNYLFRGDGKHSWATQILPIVNVRRDIDTLDNFVKDCLRAVQTNKRRLSSPGYCKAGAEGCVVRCHHGNAGHNRKTTDKEIQGYLTLGCMQNALRTSKEFYDTLVSTL